MIPSFCAKWLELQKTKVSCCVAAVVAVAAVLLLVAALRPFFGGLDRSLRAIEVEAEVIEAEVDLDASGHSAKMVKDLAHARARRRAGRARAPRGFSARDAGAGAGVGVGADARAGARRKRPTRPPLPPSTWSEAALAAPAAAAGRNGKESAGERETRDALEAVFGVDFAKSRPNFLYNAVTSTRRVDPDGAAAGSVRRAAAAGAGVEKLWPGESDDPFAEGADDYEFGSYLELDCFSKKLRVAAEFQGRQHFEFVPYFHGSVDGFFGQRYRDEIKRERCERFGVALIVVPYTVKSGDIRDFVLGEARKLGLVA